MTKGQTLSRILGIVLITIGLSACTDKPPSTPTQKGMLKSYDGTSLAYELAGRGKTAVVFVHCWTCDASFWDKQFRHFAQKYTVVRMDLAGHGNSAKSTRNYTVSNFGKDVATVVSKLGLQRVVLVGHSMGGPVSVEAAKLLGDSTLGIVGVDTFYAFELPETQAQVDEFVKPFETDFIKTNKAFIETMFLPTADKASKAHIVETILNADQQMAVELLKDIFKWYQTESKASLAKFSDRLRNINADATGTTKAKHESVVLVSGVGHFIPQIKPAEFNRELEKIIADFENK